VPWKTCCQVYLHSRLRDQMFSPIKRLSAVSDPPPEHSSFFDSSFLKSLAISPANMLYQEKLIYMNREN
jgi:hypothetical protein